jgi:hypothetical protein
MTEIISTCRYCKEKFQYERNLQYYVGETIYRCPKCGYKKIKKAKDYNQSNRKLSDTDLKNQTRMGNY